MIRYHFDLYPRDDPRDGTLVVRFTKLQSAEYRGEANGTGAGRFSIRADDAEAQLIDPRGLQYVRVVREDTVAVTEVVVGGFFLDDGDFALLDENETRLLTFGGAGTLSYLDRAIMASHTYISPIFTGMDPYDDTWRLYAQSTVYANGNFLGAMLWRVIYEAQHNTPGTHRHFATGTTNVSDTHADDRPAIAIPDLVMTFDAFEDSNGDDWAISSGEFKAQIGENVLQVVQRLMEAGLYVEMDPDTFELSAYPAATHRRDRTGGAWGTNVVRFQAPSANTVETGNIKSDARRAIVAFIKRSWLLVGGQGVFGDATGTTDIPWEGFYNADVNEVAAANNVASVQINARDDAGDTLRLRGKLGNSPTTGIYKPYEHVLLDDLATVHTGTDQFDHDEQDFPVAAITVILRPAGDWDVWYELGASYSATSRRFQATPVPAHNHTIPLCDALTPGTETVIRLYPSQDDETGITGLSRDVAWEGAGSGADIEKRLYTTPQNTIDGEFSSSLGGGGVTTDGMLAQWSYPMDATMASLIVAGGATIRGQALVRTRAGVGINELAQDLISQIGVRVTTGASTTIRGTAKTLHALGSSSGSTKWPRDDTAANRAFPAAADTNILTAVSGTVATDRLVIEVGYRNFTAVAISGGHMRINDTVATDLAEGEGGFDDLNTWVEIRGISGTTGSGNHPDLVGTSNRAARCDHKHHILSNREPTNADDITQGYPETTLWTNTDTMRTWLLVDEDTGDWRLLSDPNHEHEPVPSGTSLTIEEEDGTPSDEFDTLRVPNGSLTDNGDGSASLEAILPRHGGKEVIQAHGSAGATETIDLADGNVHTLTLDANCVLTFAGATNGVACSWTLGLAQDGSGNWTVDFPAAVVNGADLEDALDPTASTITWYSFWTLDGGTTVYGVVAGGPSEEVSTAAASHILLADGRGTPFAFNDLLQMEDGSDFMWSDPE